jgi:hypothetical protein
LRLRHAGKAASELQRVRDVVNTLTQFPTVQQVALEINGVTLRTANGTVNLSRLQGRSDVLGAFPAILLATPAVADTLYSSAG